MDKLSHDELGVLLHDSGVEVSAAETHGLVTGLLCRGVDLPGLADATHLIAGRAHQPADAAERLSELLERVWTDARRSLDGDSLEFSLLLPGDDRDLGERTRSVAHWCQGFALAFLYDDLAVDDLPADAAEAARDIVDIAALDEETDEGEASERALTEIEQYLRVAVQLLYEELVEPPDPGTG